MVAGVGAVLGFLVLAGIGIGWGIAIEVLDDGYCEQGDSNYGELSWSVVPPGPVCTWTAEANGLDEVRGPTPVMSIWLAAVVGLGALAVWGIRGVRRDPRRSSAFLDER
jgi:hypothetical protein